MMPALSNQGQLIELLLPCHEGQVFRRVSHFFFSANAYEFMQINKDRKSPSE